MDNHHAYYSEYSVKSWTSFLLNGEIKLPPYQRNFVWSLQKSFDLVKAVLDGNFIPPIVIASTQNDFDEIPKGIYLIDGQQRLTSILLFLIGVWPNEQRKKVPSSTEENEEDDLLVLPWTLSRLSNEYKKYKSFESFVLAVQQSNRYTKFSELKPGRHISTTLCSNTKMLSDRISVYEKERFLKRTLGYSFVKSVGDVETEKRLFANLFRDINSTGQKLLPAESRQAMYYLEPVLKPLFRPPFLHQYKIGKVDIDFTRYLSYVDELHMKYIETSNGDNLPSTSSIAVGYSNKPEDYIVKYLVDMINNRVQHGLTVMGNMPRFEEYFVQVFTPRNSIQDIPYFELHVYGLIFWVLFEGKAIDTSKFHELKQKFSIWLQNNNYPNKRVGGIRSRLEFSVKTYSEVLISDD